MKHLCTTTNKQQKIATLTNKVRQTVAVVVETKQNPSQGELRSFFILLLVLVLCVCLWHRKWMVDIFRCCGVTLLGSKLKVME